MSIKTYCYLLLINVCLLSGCTTVPTTGRKKLLGLVPVPFTGGQPVDSTDPRIAKMAIMAEQLAPFTWLSLILIVGGAFAWWGTGGRTGLGKFAFTLGCGLAIFATVLPQIAGWLGLVTIIAIIGVGGYLAYVKLKPARCD